MNRYKKILIFLIFFILSMNFTGIKAQSYAFLVEENNNQRTAFSVILNPQNIQYKEIKTKLGYFTKITLDETFSSETVGLPQLPTLVKIIEVPFCDSMSVVIRHIEWDSVLLTQVGMSNYIYPSQPSVFKTDNSPAFVIDSASYLRQTYYPSEEVVRVNLKGVMRQMRMAELQISPILYHPVRGMLKIIKSIQFEIVYHDVDADKTLKNKQIYSNNYFTQNTSAIVNPNQSVQKAANQKAPIKYIIVSDPMFKTTLQPFIQWKKQQGFMVVEAYTDQAEVGNTKESIKTFLKQHYTQATLSNPAQTFVL